MHPIEDDAAGASMEMPRYISHKKVWALEIDTINDNVLTFRGKGYAPIAADREMWARYIPVPGDFYVQYADGYKSFSPRKAFLEGYVRDDVLVARKPTIDELEKILHEPDRPVHINPDGSIGA